MRVLAAWLVAVLTITMLAAPPAGVAAAPPPPSGATGPDATNASTQDARTIGSRSWIVLFEPGAVAPTGAKPDLDTAVGRSAARSRAAATDRATDRLARMGGFQVSARFGWAVQGFAARLTSGQVAALRRDAAVARVVPDVPVTISAEAWPPGVRRVHAVDGETTGGPDTDIDVAVIDTGIGPVGGPTGSGAELDIAGGTDCRRGGNGSTSDGHGHGTHVAGVIGARANGLGVVGVAPGARLWAVRVFDSAGRGTTSTVICGIDWVTEWVATHSGRRMVANMSLRGIDDYAGPTRCDANGRDTRDPEHQAICTATAAGVVFVVAAGNERDDTDGYIPARYDEVITVAAISDYDGSSGGHAFPSEVSGCSASSSTEPDDAFARYSNFGAAVDVVAPGTCVRSLAPGTGSSVRTAVMTGTSMATPHVSGAVARYLADHPDADHERVRRVLIAAGNLDWLTGTDPGRADHPERAPQRLLDVSSLTTTEPGLVVWPAGASLNVGRGVAQVEVPFDLQRVGGLSGTVHVTVEDLPAGVTLVDPVSLSGLGGLRGTLTLDIANDVAPGEHSLRLTARSGATLSEAALDLLVDRAAPVIGAPWPRVTLRSGGIYDGSTNIRLAWSATDDASGVGTVELQRRSGSWKRVASAIGMTATNTTLGKNVPTSFRVRARDRAGNLSTSSVLATRLVVRDSTSIRIRWRGSWRTAARSSAAGSSVRASGAAGATATLAFTGRGVGIVAPRGPGRGKVDIAIDGNKVATVDLATTSVRPRRVVFASGQLSAGDHTITITTRRAGTELDAILILE